jgi:hypothetical protein
VKFPGRLHVCSWHETHLNRCPLFRLHGRGILEPGKRVVIEGVAEDGHHRGDPDRGRPGFALGVQWHAEYDPQRNPINGRRSLSSARRWWPADELPKANST